MLNNVFVQTGDSRIVDDVRAFDGSQFFDGNVYYRAATNPTLPLISVDRPSGSVANFWSLASFLASPEWSGSQTYYPTGWENRGVEGNPQLDAFYRPVWTGPAGSPGVNLTTRPWPGVAMQLTYRGAVLPR